MNNALDASRLGHLRLLFGDRLFEVPAGIRSAMITRMTRERLVIENPHLARFLVGVDDDVDA